jgi:hypothetical protein
MLKLSVLLALSVAVLLPVLAVGQAASQPAAIQQAANHKVDNDFVQAQFEHNYTVLDPYYTFYGYGDPKLTTTFKEGVPARQGLVVLIIHGIGPEAWRSATPKSKFVIVNLPFQAVSVRKMQLRKKTVEAVYIEEAGELGASSALFFDGKKYKYVPMGANMQ